MNVYTCYLGAFAFQFLKLSNKYEKSDKRGRLKYGIKISSVDKEHVVT